jgi:predicted XRE-type DNA-binding protein
MGNRRNSEEQVYRSSGNVFRDLDLKDADEKHTKVQLTVAINQILEEMGIPQTAAAKLLTVNQPKISALAHYRLDGFSVERLMLFLNALGRDVDIVIRKPRRGHSSGRIQVKAA